MTHDERDVARLNHEERRLLLARLLRERAAPAGVAAAVPDLVPVARDGDLPLSFAQERLWFFEQFESGTAAYNVSLTLRLRGGLDVSRLERALQRVVDRHESLRTRFEAVEGRAVQRVSPAVTTRIEILDVQQTEPVARESLLRAEMAKVARRPFDLARGTLIRSCLARVGADDHLLTVVVHHIVADGWSVGLLVREWGICYTALAEGREPVLQPLPVQYADYAVWQRRVLEGEALERDLSYWRRTLADTPPSLDLPLDHPRPERQVFDSAECQALLRPATVNAVRELSRTGDTTPFMTLLAGFHVLAHRLTGETHVAVGFPIAGRNRREVEGLVGMFVNTLVLSLEVDPRRTFRDLLGATRRAALEAYGHQDLPFEKLVEHLRPTRDLSRTPVFQLLFNMIPPASSAFSEWGGLEVTAEGAPDLASHFDLTLYVRDAAPALGLLLVYNPTLFSAPRMSAMLEQYEQLLERCVADPDAPIGTHSLVTPGFAGSLPDPAAPLPREPQPSLLDAFRARVASAPANVAIVSGDRRYTYEDVDLRSTRVRDALVAAGVSPGDVVAVLADRTPALVWTLIGVLKAGAAFTILDPFQPEARLTAQIAAASPKAWVGVDPVRRPEGEVRAALGRLPAGEAVPGMEPGLAPRSEAPAVVLSGDSPAYVAFTSGTTGGVKAVLSTHGPVAHFVEWQARTFGLSAEDRFSMLSGLAHDPLLRDLFTPLSIGAAVCVPPADVTLEPRQLSDYLTRAGVTVVHLTPPLGEVLAQGASRAPVSGVKYLFFGGDLLSRSLVERLEHGCPGARCVNFYGATETPQAMSYSVVERASESGDGRLLETVPVGRGIEDVQLLVLNGVNGLAGVGEIGEICIRTPYLSRGYLNDRDLTANRFVVNPFTGDPADRLYRTGDRGRYRPDGQVEFAGRTDAQVKIRGYRVEPGEIEARLTEHPSVAQAVVVVRGESASERHLVAYCVPRQGRDVDVDGVRRLLSGTLPAYMVPSTFVVLAAIPMTPNGKIDIRSLPPPGNALPDEREGAPPRTPTEEALVRVWCGVLRRERIGVHDNFFDAGGHSLLAMQVASRIREALGVELPVRSLFESPTIGMLATRIDALRGRTPARSAVPLRRVAREARRVEVDAAGAPILLNPAGDNRP